MSPSVQETLDDADTVVVPSLYSSEVANALWKYVHLGELTLDDAKAMLSNALGFANTEQLIDASLATEALGEACRLTHPVYDLIYAVLARRLSAPLITCDGRLASVAETLGIEVIGCKKDES